MTQAWGILSRRVQCRIPGPPTALARLERALHSGERGGPATPYTRGEDETMLGLGLVGRRRLIQGFVAMLTSAVWSVLARSEDSQESRPIVRISRGSFPPEKYEEIERMLDAARGTLVPAIQQLAGCLHFFAAIDRESSSMVNVSVWRSLADAQQMQTLAPMLALAEQFTREGVRFERPVVNYRTLWATPPALPARGTRP